MSYGEFRIKMGEHYEAWLSNALRGRSESWIRARVEGCDNFRDQVSCGFSWFSSPEGDTFWNDIADERVSWSSAVVPLNIYGTKPDWY